MAVVLQLLVQLDAVPDEVAMADRFEQAERARTEMGSTAADTVLLQDEDIPPAVLEQVVGHGIRDNARPGYYHPCLGGKGGVAFYLGSVGEGG